MGIVIAIDGPAAAGKGTLARALAERLGLAHLDTGSLYRAVARVAMDRGVDPSDHAACSALAAELDVSWTRRPDIRGEAVGQVASKVSATAAAAGLREAARAGARRIVMRLDSNYVKDGITSWIHGWKRRGWVTASGDPVRNRDLWQELDAAVADARAGGASIAFEWVRGHAGNPGNERADELAGLARAALDPTPARP